jgi:hypothetical protein
MPSASAVRDAAIECATLEEAAERLGAGVGTLLKTRARSNAWERGRLLRRVREVAGTTYVVVEAADKLLKMGKGEFARLYARDAEVREVWDSERFGLLLATEQGFAARVQDGDLKAIAAVEALFAPRRPEAAEVDFEHLSPSEMARATGLAHQQLNRWAKEHGLYRAADGTYSLPRFVAWVRQWEVRKLGAQAAGRPVDGESALERLRRLQGDEIEGRVYQRTDVIAMLRTRAAWLTQLLSEARAEQWAHEHEGQTAAQLKGAYITAFETLRRRWCDWPEELPLPPAAKQKIEEALTLLTQEPSG